jgi:hypothetical protein
MNNANFFSELKRRNVYKIAVAYAVVGWLLAQIATQVFLTDSWLRGLRDDPRYQNLLGKLGLPTTS